MKTEYSLVKSLLRSDLQMNRSCDIISAPSLIDLEQYVLMKKKEILSNHHSAIIQLNKGTYKGYWQTFVRDPNTNKRKQIRAKTKEDVEKRLIDFYTKDSFHTVKQCYSGWIEYLRINKKASTIHTYEKVYKRHFEKIENECVEKMTPMQIKMFVKREVADGNMTAKAYASLKTNLLGIFHYAKDQYGYDLNIDSIVADLSRELRGSFKRSDKSRKTDEELVFMPDEEKLLTEYCKKSGSMVDLGINLLFFTGLRVGELAALKKEDIAADRKSIHICRTEERISSKAEYIVVDTAKTEAGVREVLLVDEAQEVLTRILRLSDPNSEYLFADECQNRYPAKKFRDRLYRNCNYLGLRKRGLHAIRRTYASKLARAGVSEALIIKQMGHVDFSITKAFYIYNTKTRNDLISELESAVNN